jgi:hypothetical protein
MTTSGLEIIAAERLGQLHFGCYTADQDDNYVNGELLLAARCYAEYSIGVAYGPPPNGWPWGMDSWRPTPNNQIKNLAKAGALIAAEIDRLKRLPEKLAREKKAKEAKMAEDEKARRAKEIAQEFFKARDFAARQAALKEAKSRPVKAMKKDKNKKKGRK